MRVRLDDGDYSRLLDFRDGLRRFLHWSGERAGEAGLTPAQHQLLLAVRAHDGAGHPTVGDVADHLLLRHHSAVGLVDRAEAAGLVARSTDPADHRVVRVRLTALGSRRLAALTALHVEELRRLGAQGFPIWAGLDEAPPSPAPVPPAAPAPRPVGRVSRR
ncbi:MAG: MarR family winged helix-turn-helix transcriptional regulator [Acidimicrobiales bacterium]